MKCTVLITILSIASSYSSNTERPAAETFDTVQWWITPTKAYRIKTYAMDADLHVHIVDSKPDILTIARENNKKHYGDVTSRVFEIEGSCPFGTKNWTPLLKARGLAGMIEESKTGTPFWNPDGRPYRSQTKPE